MRWPYYGKAPPRVVTLEETLARCKTCRGSRIVVRGDHGKACPECRANRREEMAEERFDAEREEGAR